MANCIRPDILRYRPFIILTIPALFLACVGATSCVLLVTRDAQLSIPLVIITFGPSRLMRWVMVWLSTPEEQRIFASGLNHEPLIGIIRAWISGKIAEGQAKGPSRAGAGNGQTAA
jgi:hypothetical protein